MTVVGNLTKNGLGSMVVWGATVFPKRLLSIFYLAGSFKKPNRAFRRSFREEIRCGSASCAACASLLSIMAISLFAPRCSMMTLHANCSRRARAPAAVDVYVVQWAPIIGDSKSMHTIRD